MKQNLALLVFTVAAAEVYQHACLSRASAIQYKRCSPCLPCVLGTGFFFFFFFFFFLARSHTTKAGAQHGISCGGSASCVWSSAVPACAPFCPNWVAVCASLRSLGTPAGF